MNSSTIKLYSLGLTDIKVYLYVSLFVLGNLLFPQLCHLVPSGGITFLPIYFFTLIAAYKYGIHAGVLTAIFSALVNYLLFGMPGLAVLPIILIKSILLALVAASAAHYFKKLTLLILLAIVLTYQVIGTAVEWVLVKDFFIAIQDFRIGVPGMLIQVIGGYAILKWSANL